MTFVNSMGLTESGEKCKSQQAIPPSSGGTSKQDSSTLRELPARRLDYIDNLRSSLLFLVVAFHTTITYSHIGSWYYSEPGKVDGVSAVVFFAFEAHCQAFFMGLLFLLAGYFVPEAYDRKGFRLFLGHRFMRLGVPSLLYMFAVQPLLQHYLLHYGDNFGGYYSRYILSGDVLTGSGPMWFALALLVFSLVYAVLRAVRQSTSNAPRQAVPGLGALLAVGLSLGLVSFVVRLAQPLGTSILNMQLCFFPQYIVLFAVGIFAFRNDWLARLPTGLGNRMLGGVAFFSPAVLLPLIVWGGFVGRGLSPYLGGWQWQSASYALWEQTACVALCAGLLVFYRERINNGSRIWKILAADSFGIYLLHPPVVVAVSQGFGWLRLPPLLKAAVMVPIACLCVWVFVHFVARRVPLLRRII